MDATAWTPPYQDSCSNYCLSMPILLATKPMLSSQLFKENNQPLIWEGTWFRVTEKSDKVKAKVKSRKQSKSYYIVTEQVLA